jgi:hypothetical protein
VKAAAAMVECGACAVISSSSETCECVCASRRRYQDATRADGRPEITVERSTAGSGRKALLVVSKTGAWEAESGLASGGGSEGRARRIGKEG